MKKLIKYVIADKILKWSFGVTLFLITIQFAYIGVFYVSLPPLIPLFNQMQWGEERLGTRIEFFLPIVIAAIFSLLNLFLAQKLYEKMPLVSRIVGITTVLVNILSLVFIMRTLQLVI